MVTTPARPRPSHSDAHRTEARTTATIDNPEAAVEVFSDLEPTIAEVVDAVPDKAADDADAFANSPTTPVESGDLIAFGDCAVNAIVARLDALCTNN